MAELIFDKYCDYCKKRHPIEEFPFTSYIRKDGTRGRLGVCLQGRRARITASYMRKDLETRRAQKRESHARCAAQRSAYNRNYAEEHKEAEAEYSRQWRKKKTAEGYFRTPYRRAWGRAYRLANKLRIFDAYGGRQCVCCPESNISMLTLDHVAGDGNIDRRTSHHQGQNRNNLKVYRRVVRDNFPPGFRFSVNRATWASIFRA